MRILIVVTHLLGTGHLGRALVLGRTFAAAGHRVVVASGGRPAPHLDSTGVEMVQLPPLASDGVNFTRLLDINGAEATPDIYDVRRAQLRDTLHALVPDVLITELYPFGRRVLRAEFLDLLAEARDLPRTPWVLSSIRDILAPPSKPERAGAAAQVFAEFYDGALVHSDPSVIKLEQSWPVTPEMGTKLLYTGFVAAPPPDPHPSGDGRGEVLVTTGGGAVGDDVFAAALDAARLRPDLRFRLLIGGGADRAAAWATRAQGVAKVEPVRPDFRQMLREARACISYCGYNTAMDLLLTGVPSVIIPFDAGREVEQSLRAQSLAQLDGIESVTSTDLTGAALAQALDRALAAPARDVSGVQFDGAAQGLALIEAATEARA